jgi:hypothetical protein
MKIFEIKTKSESEKYLKAGTLVYVNKDSNNFKINFKIGEFVFVKECFFAYCQIEAVWATGGKDTCWFWTPGTDSPNRYRKNRFFVFFPENGNNAND